VKLSEDWFEDLLALPRSKVSPALLKVYRDCVLQTALLRAASTIGRSPGLARDVADTLLETAYVHQGTFRDEVSRAIAAVGDELVPHLVVFGISPSDRARDQDKPEVRRALFAQHSLDKIDRLHPARATTAVREDPRLLAATLAAYGLARPGEAASVLLDFVDDRSPAVRKAAREAFANYVFGPPPTVSARRVRLIGGGTGVALAYLSYRERARLAIRERLGAEAPALLEEECELKREDGRWDKRCEEQPARLYQAYVHWLDLRRELDQTARIDAALADPDPDAAALALDRLLAVSPDIGQRDRLAKFFGELAQAKLDAGERQRAAALFRKASMLERDRDPERARALHVAALRAEADLAELPRAGRLMLLRRAADLEPDDREIAAAVERVQAEPALVRSAEVGGNRLLGGIGLLSVCLFALGLLGAPLRRRL
jgi:tetratricopeptide (TPR) repeat protein